MGKDQLNKLSAYTQQLLSQHPDSAYMENLQSVIGMVHTLIQEGKMDELSHVLHIHFPQYYTTSRPLIFSEN